MTFEDHRAREHKRKPIAQTQWSAKKKACSLTKKPYTKRKAHTHGGKRTEAESRDRTYEALAGPTGKYYIHLYAGKNIEVVRHWIYCGLLL